MFVEMSKAHKTRSRTEIIATDQTRRWKNDISVGEMSSLYQNKSNISVPLRLRETSLPAARHINLQLCVAVLLGNHSNTATQPQYHDSRGKILESNRNSNLIFKTVATSSRQFKSQR